LRLGGPGVSAAASHRRLERCRICGSQDLDRFLDLGETPLANAFVAPDRQSEPELRFPLDVLRCVRCGLVQLSVVVRPDILFGQYLYATSASEPMVQHFAALAEEIVRRFAPRPSLVVEVGSNDGVLLRQLRARGATPLGIEPAANLAAQANAEGLETWTEYFATPVAHQIVAERGRARVVVANNTLAQIDGLGDVARAVSTMLDDDGVFLAEVPYLAHLLERVEYDTIYHEHLSYFALAPLDTLFKQSGLELFDVRHLPTHGGSIRIYVGRPGAHAETAELAAARGAERDARLGDDVTYARFAARVAASREALRTLLGELARAGHRIAGLGATAKSCTLLHYCGIGRETLGFIGDSTPLKQGLLTPGTHIPVRPEAAIEADGADRVLLLAWNYADAIVRRHSDFIARGGRFVHPIPFARLVP
jgi:novobiocin biosynthesis protein NovU/D-mycarose 3-C-methyltransferase